MNTSDHIPPQKYLDIITIVYVLYLIALGIGSFTLVETAVIQWTTLPLIPAISFVILPVGLVVFTIFATISARILNWIIGATSLGSSDD